MRDGHAAVANTKIQPIVAVSDLLEAIRERQDVASG